MSERDLPLADAHGPERARLHEGLKFAGASSQGPRELVSPFALLLLADSPGHGYALAARLKSFGFDWGGPGPLYSHLRELQRRELVRSTLSPGCAGPVRRTYALTSSGHTALHVCAGGIRTLRHTLAQLLCEMNGSPTDGLSTPSSQWPLPPVPDNSASLRLSLGQIEDPAKTDETTAASSPDSGGDIGYPRELVLAGILAIVAREPADSAAIVARLRVLGFVWEGAGPVFAHLHSLTAACLVGWCPPAGSAGGRAKRVYQLSPAGTLAMPAWVDYLHGLYSKLTRWSQEYARLTEGLNQPTSFPS